MRFANLTDVGRQREHNEDNLLSSVFTFGEGRRRMEYGLHIVADGMGGAAAGEVASSLTVETISLVVYHRLLQSHIDLEQSYVNPGRVLQSAVEQANHKVYTTAREIPQFLGMGATVTCMIVCQGKLFIAQVGDSRAYLLRDRKLKQITRDHSFVGEMLREGRLTEAQARNHPRKNIITRAVGSRLKVQVDVFREDLRPGDIVLACSDGLSGMVTDDEIAALLMEGQRLRTDQMSLCEQLVKRANDAGGTDNITVSLVSIETQDVPARPMDHIYLVPNITLTWDEAARLELEDSSFVKVEV